jgi:hypothetical protein
MILIYTDYITARVTYTMDLVFKTVINTSFELTTSKEVFNNSKLSKIAYTKVNEGFDVFIKSDTLLFETDIKINLPTAENSFVDFPKFYKSNTNDFLGYDIFAMVFYFATRYEEYLNAELDEHQRFKAENSVAHNYNCLQIPFLNLAIAQFADLLKQKFPNLYFKKREFSFLSTIDIDNAFAFANKGFQRNVGGLLKDLASLKFKQVASRIISNLDEEKDPYNTFQLINSLSKETQTALYYFILIGDYSAYDKNPSFKSRGFKKLLRTLLNENSIGLHPSYESFNHPEKIEIEKKRLEDIIEKKVTSARCHFLRIKFPDTYRQFINVGITDDYTMIYASQSGYRTGLCVPYNWFDLEKNESTNLTIHPSTIMEGTLRDYNKYSPEKATEVISQLLDQSKKQGGEFISVWHNDSFVPSQKNWIEVYKKLLINSKSINS